jgi:hypothetical protein
LPRSAARLVSPRSFRAAIRCSLTVMSSTGMCP